MSNVNFNFSLVKNDLLSNSQLMAIVVCTLKIQNLTQQTHQCQKGKSLNHISLFLEHRLDINEETI